MGFEEVGIVGAADIGQGDGACGGFAAGRGEADVVVSLGIEGEDLRFEDAVVTLEGFAFFSDGGSARIAPLEVNFIADAVVGLEDVAASIDFGGCVDIEFAFFADGGGEEQGIASAIVGLDAAVGALGKEAFTEAILDFVDELLVSAVLSGGLDLDLGVGELALEGGDWAFAARGLFGNDIEDLDGIASADTDTVGFPTIAQGGFIDCASDIEADFVVKLGEADGFAIDGAEGKLFALDFEGGDAFEFIEVEGFEVRPFGLVVIDNLLELLEGFASDGAVVVFADDLDGAGEVVEAHG